MATLLAAKGFTKNISLLLRRHTTNQNFFGFYWVRYFYCQIFFLNNGVTVNTNTPRYMYTQVKPSDESWTNYVALPWFEVGQPWHTLSRMFIKAFWRFASVAKSQCHNVGHCPLCAAYRTTTDAILAIGYVPFPVCRVKTEFTWVSTQGTLNKIHDSLP
jgi:hypothetical protein